MKRRWFQMAVAGLAVAGATAAIAQNPPTAPAAGAGAAAGETPRHPTDLGENKVLQDQAARALKMGDWGKAIKLFEKLKQAQPDVLEFRLNYALCLYNTPGKLNEAKEIYEQVLSVDGENIQALSAVARIFLKTAQGERDPAKKAEAHEQVRDALRRAARNGCNALRAIKNYPEFAELKTDVTLQLDIIREPQAFRIDTPGGRDPFYNPLPRKDEPGGPGPGPGPEPTPGPGGLSPADQDNLIKRLEVLFQEIDPLVSKNDFDGLGKKWGEIDEILRREKQITSIDLAPKFKELMKRHREKLPVIKSLLLRSYYTDGERIIDRIRSAYEAEQDYRKVFELWDKLQAYSKKMIATDEQFAQPAQDLLSQAKPMFDNATKLQEVGQMKLNVSAIVTGGGISQGIVNNRIVTEGDIVYDVQGNPIPDLRVVQIKKRRIKFQYKGLDYEPKHQLAVR